MAVPRVALVAVVGALLIVAAFMVTRQQAATPDEAGSATQQVAPAAEPEPAQREPAAAADDAAPATRIPGPVERALEREQVVVLTFTQHRGADDRATRARVEHLRDSASRSFGDRVRVFTDDVGELASYAAAIGELGIDQAPATVVIGRDGEAVVVQGFLDERSLRQHVSDAL